MAHTNAPGTTHRKRWQDIEELLDRGIDVCTTLNVQHIESLNDDIARIIQAPIKETVPDRMIETADTIELIDLPPEELLNRLEEGKVYFLERAEVAAKNFFKKGNLIALRELALRTVADRVNNQGLLYRQGQGIKDIWATKEKILVCVGPGDESKKLIRAARRMAMSLQIKWSVVFVDAPKLQFSDIQKNKAIQNLHFAEQMGASTRVLIGDDIVKEIMTYAREQNVTQVMVFKNIRPRIRNIFFRDLADEIVRHSGEIDVYIMTGESIAFTAETHKKRKKTSSTQYLISALAVTLFTIINIGLSSLPFIGTGTLIMVYLLGITLVALLSETVPALFSALLSAFAADFFFIPPLYSFDISDIQYVFTLVVMLLISFIISRLTIRVKKQAIVAKAAERQTAFLHTLSRQLVSIRGADKILAIGSQYIAEIFNCQVETLLSEKGRLVLQLERKGAALPSKEEGIAMWVYELGKIAGKNTDTLSFSEALYIPLSGTKKTIGVWRIILGTEQLLTPDQMYLLEACAN